MPKKCSVRITAVAIVFILTLTPFDVYAVDADSTRCHSFSATIENEPEAWNGSSGMFVREPIGNGQSFHIEPSPAAPETDNVQWVSNIGLPMNSAPVLSDDGCYGISSNGTVFSVDPNTGRLVWEKTVCNQTRSSPALSGEYILVTTSDGLLVALDLNTGVERWRIVLSGIPTSAVLSGDTAFIGTDTGILHAIDVSVSAYTNPSRYIWNYSVGGAVEYTPTPFNGTVFVISGNAVHSVSEKTGLRDWIYISEYNISTPVSVSEERAYFCTGMEIVAVSTADGETVWRNGTGSAYSATKPCVNQDSVLIGTDSGEVRAYDAVNGTLLWSVFVSSAVSNPMSFAEGVMGGVIFASSNDAQVYAISGRDGKIIWDFETGEPALLAPAVSSERLVVSSVTGKFFCFYGSVTGLDAEWIELPSTVTGGATANVSVRVSDSMSGQPVSNAFVTLSSSLGGVFHPSYYGTTDELGVFRVQFGAPNLPGTILFTATAAEPNHNDGYGYGRTQIQFIPTIQLELTSDRFIIPSGGNTMLYLNVTVNGAPLGDAFVNFTSIYGTIANTNSITGSDGHIRAKYNARETSVRFYDLITVTAQKPGYIPGSTYMMLEIRPYVRILMAASPLNILPGSISNISLFTSGGDNRPLGNVDVLLSADGGTIYPQRGVTSADGRFTATFVADSDCSACTKDSGISLRNCSINVYAEKIDHIYTSAVLNILVSAPPGRRPLLRTEFATGFFAVNEHRITNITVCVRDASTGKPVSDADVTFVAGDNSGLFSPVHYLGNGIYLASFRPFTVSGDFWTVITATAIKSGYEPCSSSAIVRIIKDTLDKLYVSAATPTPDVMYYENAEITVCVRDSGANAVTNASLNISAARKDCTITVKPTTYEERMNGIYKFCFRGAALNASERYNLTVHASFGSASGIAYLTVTVRPPAKNLPICRITSAPQGHTSEGLLTIRGEAYAHSGKITLVEVQVSPDRKIYSTAWKPAEGTDNWSYEINIGDVGAAAVRVYARCSNGTEYSKPVFVDLWINEPSDEIFNEYIKIIAAGVGGSGAAVLFAAFWMSATEKRREEKKRKERDLTI